MRQKKLIVSILLFFSYSLAYSQQDSLFFLKLDSFVGYLDSLKLKSTVNCATEENFIFLDKLSSYTNKELRNGEELKETLSVSDSLVIFKPYGNHKPRVPFSQTVISLLEREPLIILLEFTTIGGYYEYFECVEKYYFSYEGNEWQQISY